MRAFAQVAVLVAVLGIDASVGVVEDISSSLIHEVLHAKWTTYKAQHRKEYAPHIDATKKTAFLANTRTIEEHNGRFHQGLETFHLGHNALSDLTLEEILTTRMGARLPDNHDEVHGKTSEHVNSIGSKLPENFDWRDKNAVGPVRDQGDCGSCYTFSATGALETAHWRKHGTLPAVSKQQLIDCTVVEGNRGCGGGWMHSTFKWLKEHDGYAAEAAYNYTAREGTCRSANVTKIGKVVDYVRIPRGDEEALLDAIATVGPVSVAYNANAAHHHLYSGGIIDIPDCRETPVHAVLVVGYGTENGTDFWTIKNSWGPNWGEKGYFRMRRGKNMCGIANWASYPYIE